jgi:hypothetical protein
MTTCDDSRFFLLVIGKRLQRQPFPNLAPAKVRPAAMLL